MCTMYTKKQKKKKTNEKQINLILIYINIYMIYLSCIQALLILIQGMLAKHGRRSLDLYVYQSDLKQT